MSILRSAEPSIEHLHSIELEGHEKLGQQDAAYTTHARLWRQGKRAYRRTAQEPRHLSSRTTGLGGARWCCSTPARYTIFGRLQQQSNGDTCCANVEADRWHNLAHSSTDACDLSRCAARRACCRATVASRSASNLVQHAVGTSGEDAVEAEPKLQSELQPGPGGCLSTC